MKKIKTLYNNLNKFAFWVTLLLSASLIITSFILPPTGVIDPSVLAATGELFAFGTLACVITSIEKGSNTVSVTKGDTTISINNENNEPTEI